MNLKIYKVWLNWIIELYSLFLFCSVSVLSIYLSFFLFSFSISIYLSVFLTLRFSVCLFVGCVLNFKIFKYSLQVWMGEYRFVCIGLLTVVVLYCSGVCSTWISPLDDNFHFIFFFFLSLCLGLYFLFYHVLSFKLFDFLLLQR